MALPLLDLWRRGDPPRNLRPGQGGCVPCGKIPSAFGRHVDGDGAAGLMRRYGFEALGRYPGGDSDRPWSCRCLVCGTVSTPRHTNVHLWLQACPTCASRKRAEEYRLPEDVAVASMLLTNLAPLEP